MLVQESFAATRVAADGTATLTGRTRLGGFVCDTAGTLTLTINGTTMLNAMDVAEGVFYPLPFDIVGTSSIALGGGAAGCVAAI